jgi:predicted RNA methylase/predicted transglutaminase-like cysteine proteinase
MKQVVSTKATLRDTVKEIISVIGLNKSNQSFMMPDYLKRSTKMETCKAVWYFVKNNINYKPDQYLTEQIRTPDRTWKDRKQGVDCEDYSIYIACILLRLGVVPTLKIVGDKQGFKHIYVVVRDDKTDSMIVMDCCMDDFNSETTFNQELIIDIGKDAEMIVPEAGGYMLERLSGVADLEKSTAEILAYEGKGSKGKTFGVDKGILYQFFTPDWLIELMWKLCIHHGFEGGNVLEPSCGTGRFMYYAPKDLTIDFTAFEIEKMLADNAKQLCPEATIYHGGFETAFLKSINGFWHKLGNVKHGENTWLPPMDLVIGNPPYGQIYDKYSIGADIKRFGQIEQYFMLQGLKVLKSGGLMCYITASSFASTYERYMKTKMEMDNLCTLVDAYRLPNVFKNTNVPTDILIFRKK